MSTRLTIRFSLAMTLCGLPVMVSAQQRPDLYADDGARPEAPTGESNDDDRKKKKNEPKSNGQPPTPGGAGGAGAGDAGPSADALHSAGLSLGGVGLPLADALSSVSAAGGALPPGAAPVPMAGAALGPAGAAGGGAAAGGAVAAGAAGGGAAGGGAAAGGAAGGGAAGAGTSPVALAGFKLTALGAVLIGPSNALALTPELITVLAEDGTSGLMSAAELTQLDSTAQKMLASGNFTIACQLHEQALRAERTESRLAGLANCYEKAGRNASAWLAFTTAAGVAKDEPLRTRSSAQAERLLARVSRLQLAIAPELESSVEASFDGHPVMAAHWNQALPLDPGDHTVIVRSGGTEAMRKVLTVGASASQLVLSYPDGGAAVAQEALPATEQPWYISKRVLFTGSLTLLSAAASGVVGVLALSKRSDFRESNTQPGFSKEELTTLRDDARLHGQISTAFGGLAAIGLGLTTWFIFADNEDEDEERPPTNTAGMSPWLDRTGAGISFKGAL